MEETNNILIEFHGRFDTENPYFIVPDNTHIYTVPIVGMPFYDNNRKLMIENMKINNKPFKPYNLMFNVMFDDKSTDINTGISKLVYENGVIKSKRPINLPKKNENYNLSSIVQFLKKDNDKPFNIFVNSCISVFGKLEKCDYLPNPYQNSYCGLRRYDYPVGNVFEQEFINELTDNEKNFKIKTYDFYGYGDKGANFVSYFSENQNKYFYDKIKGQNNLNMFKKYLQQSLHLYNDINQLNPIEYDLTKDINNIKELLDSPGSVIRYVSKNRPSGGNQILNESYRNSTRRGYTPRMDSYVNQWNKLKDINICEKIESCNNINGLNNNNEVIVLTTNNVCEILKMTDGIEQINSD